jgi:dihydropteroate synthase
VWAGDEVERVVPVIRQLASGGAAVSIDTRKAEVMSAALGAGARLVNDVSALTFDPRSAEVVAASGAPVVLMHHQGDPETMQDAPRYDDVLVEVYLWLEERVAAAEAAGIARSKILVDPGFGFGKTVAHNLELMNGLALLHGLGCPIVLGASRKRTIGALSDEAPAGQRLGGSIALAVKAGEQGAQLIRVHDVFETVQALKIWRGLRDQALTPRV